MYYLPHSEGDTSSNRREPCGPLMDGLCVGFEEKKDEAWTVWVGVEGGGDWCIGIGVGEGVSQMSSPLKEN